MQYKMYFCHHFTLYPSRVLGIGKGEESLGVKKTIPSTREELTLHIHG